MTTFHIKIRNFDGYIVLDASNKGEAERLVKRMFRKTAREDGEIKVKIASVVPAPVVEIKKPRIVLKKKTSKESA